MISADRSQGTTINASAFTLANNGNVELDNESNQSTADIHPIGNTTASSSPNPGPDGFPATSIASQNSTRSNANASASASPDTGASLSSSSSSTLIGSDTSAQSTANASAAASPDPEASAPAPFNSEVTAPAPAPAPTHSISPASSSPSHSSTFSALTETSSTITFSGLGITQSMNAPAEMPRAGVRFSNVTTVHNPDGGTSEQPANIPPSSSASSAASQKGPESSAAAPPSGPPRNPPASPAAPADAPEPNNNRYFSPTVSSAAATKASSEGSPETVGASSPTMNNNNRRGMVHIGPPINIRQRDAMAQMNQPTYVILTGTPAPAPAQNMAFAAPNANQPYLWINPPLVAPSVPPPQPGTSGSWCYPRQSPFWSGALADQTIPPPQFYMADHVVQSGPTPPQPLYVAEQAQAYVAQQPVAQPNQPQLYIAQPGYVATFHNAPPQQQQAPQVQYYVNGTTGPQLYYRT